MHVHLNSYLYKLCTRFNFTFFQEYHAEIIEHVKHILKIIQINRINLDSLLCGSNSIMELVEMLYNCLKHLLAGLLAFAKSSLILTGLFQYVLNKFYLLQERK